MSQGCRANLGEQVYVMPNKKSWDYLKQRQLRASASVERLYINPKTKSNELERAVDKKNSQKDMPRMVRSKSIEHKRFNAHENRERVNADPTLREEIKTLNK